MLLRLTAPGRGLLIQQPLLSANFGGAEANVAVSLATIWRAAHAGMPVNAEAKSIVSTPFADGEFVARLAKAHDAAINCRCQ